MNYNQVINVTFGATNPFGDVQNESCPEVTANDPGPLGAPRC